MLLKCLVQDQSLIRVCGVEVEVYKRLKGAEETHSSS